MGSANRKAKQAGEEANKLIKQVSGDTGVESALNDPAKAQAAPGDAEISADPEKNLNQPTPPELGAEPKKAGEDWEARFKGLQNAYDRDVPKLRGELQTAYSDIGGLQKDIDELKVAINKPAEPVAEVPEFSDEELEQYGPGQIGMMQRIAEGTKSELAQTILGLQETVAELKAGQDRIVEHTVVSDEQKFFDSLNRDVPDWQKINTLQAFHDFLDEVVPYSNQTKGSFLTDARSNLNAPEVTRIFKEFLGTAPNSSSHLDEPELKPDLDVPENLVTPENLGGGVPPVAEEKYYTNEQVTKFYNDKAAGKYKGKEDEARVIENDIFAAGKTGRIITSKQAEKAYRFDSPSS